LDALFSTTHAFSVGSLLQKSEMGRERFATIKRLELVLVSSNGSSKLRVANGVVSWTVPFGCWSSSLTMKTISDEFCDAIPLLISVDLSMLPKAHVALGKLLVDVDLEVDWKSITRLPAFLKIDDDARREVLLNRLFDILRTNLR
jgi:hypothetical protein